jgi:hypothetical protein
MRAIHLSGLRDEIMIELTEYMIDKVKKSMRAESNKR